MKPKTLRPTARAPSMEAIVDAPDRGADGPAALARDAEIVTIGGAARGSVAVERIEVKRVFATTLARLWRLGLIDAVDLLVGDRFAALWRQSAGDPRVVARLDGAPPGRTVADGAGRALDARAVLNRASDCVSAFEWATLVSVCGMDQQAAGRTNTLKSGLAILAREWGYETTTDRRRNHGA